MLIRPAKHDDAAAISALIFNVAHFFTVHPKGEGAEEFFKTISPEAVAEYVAADNFNYLLALIDDELAGFVAVRDNKHLYHLFVAPKFQRKNIAERLWNLAKTSAIDAGNPNNFTVNSTPYAAPVYERFGFKVAGPRVEMHGIAFIPMTLTD